MPAQSIYTLTIEDEDLCMREILRRRMGFSGRLVKKIKYDGQLFLDGKPVQMRDKGRRGEVLKAVYPEESSYFEPQDIPLDIVFEDDNLLIVNKQPGIVVHPTKNYQTGTLANGLAKYIADSGQSWKIRFVNRIDRDTSGLVIVAKDPHSQDVLSEQMKKDQIIKRYIAIVHGIVESDGTVDLPIMKDPDHVARRRVDAAGYPSVTHYKVLERFPAEHGSTGLIDGYSLLELKLDTGRTHQIRVHMSHIGYPLLGDELYAGLYGYSELPQRMPRQALHSVSLEFPHPWGKGTVKVSSELPADMAEAIEYLRGGGII